MSATDIFSSTARGAGSSARSVAGNTSSNTAAAQPEETGQPPDRATPPAPPTMALPLRCSPRPPRDPLTSSQPRTIKRWPTYVRDRHAARSRTRRVGGWRGGVWSAVGLGASIWGFPAIAFASTMADGLTLVSSLRPSSEVGRRRGARGSGPFPSAPSRTVRAPFDAYRSPVFISGWWLWPVRRGCPGGIVRRPRGSCVCAWPSGAPTMVVLVDLAC